MNVTWVAGCGTGAEHFLSMHEMPGLKSSTEKKKLTLKVCLKLLLEWLNLVATADKPWQFLPDLLAVPSLNFLVPQEAGFYALPQLHPFEAPSWG